jgi:hypothetical protein
VKNQGVLDELVQLLRTTNAVKDKPLQVKDKEGREGVNEDVLCGLHLRFRFGVDEAIQGLWFGEIENGLRNGKNIIRLTAVYQI